MQSRGARIGCDCPSRIVVNFDVKQDDGAAVVARAAPVVVLVATYAKVSSHVVYGVGGSGTSCCAASMRYT